MIYSGWAELRLTACLNHPHTDRYTGLAYLSLTRCGQERRGWPDVVLHGEISEKWTVDVGPRWRPGLRRRNKTHADGTENASTLRRPPPTDRAGVCADQRKRRCLGWNVPADGQMEETAGWDAGKCRHSSCSVRTHLRSYNKVCGLGLQFSVFYFVLRQFLQARA